jgi:RNA 2',3'-cyclic 3'-phosphodiesterase
VASPGWRLFIALPLPDQAGAALWQSLAVARSRNPDVRWTQPPDYHATLVFLGATPPTAVEQIGARLRATGADWPPIQAGSGPVAGVIREKGSGVAWLQIGTGRRTVSDLSVALERAVQGGANARQLPHVTLARRVDSASLEEIRRALHEVEMAWLFTRVVLYRSHATPSGSRYEELASTSLGVT